MHLVPRRLRDKCSSRVVKGSLRKNLYVAERSNDLITETFNYICAALAWVAGS